MTKNFLAQGVVLDPEQTTEGTSQFAGLVNVDEAQLYGFTPYVTKADMAAAEAPVEIDEDTHSLAAPALDAEAGRLAKVLSGQPVAKRERGGADEVSSLEVLMGAREIERRSSTTAYVIDRLGLIADSIVAEWADAEFERRSELTGLIFGPGMTELVLVKASIEAANTKTSTDRLLALADLILGLELVKSKSSRKVWAEALVKAATKVSAERIALVRAIANDTGVRIGVLNAPRTRNGGNDGMLDAVWVQVSAPKPKPRPKAKAPVVKVEVVEVAVVKAHAKKTSAKKNPAKAKAHKARKAAPAVQTAPVEVVATPAAAAQATPAKARKGKAPWWAARKARKAAAASTSTPLEAHAGAKKATSKKRRPAQSKQA